MAGGKRQGTTATGARMNPPVMVLFCDVRLIAIKFIGSKSQFEEADEALKVMTPLRAPFATFASRRLPTHATLALSPVTCTPLARVLEAALHTNLDQFRSLWTECVEARKEYAEQKFPQRNAEPIAITETHAGCITRRVVGKGKSHFMVVYLCH